MIKGLKMRAKRGLTIQIRKCDPKIAEDILARFSEIKKPPRLSYDSHEHCYETTFDLIYDKKSGKYWCGYGIYYILEAKKEIELRRGEVKIINPEQVEFIGRK